MMIPGILAQRRHGGGAPLTLLLDLYPGAVVAFSSSRKLRSAYTGAAYRVRRASDNAEQDIGFTAGGEVDQTAIATFCSGTTGRVIKWYDQSGNAVDADQPELAKAPIIYQSGAVTLINSTPALLFSGAQGMNTAANVPWPVSVGVMTVIAAYRLTASGIQVLLEAGYPLLHRGITGGLLLDLNEISTGTVMIGGSGDNGYTAFGYGGGLAVPHNRVFKGVWNPGGDTVSEEIPTFRVNNADVSPTKFNNPRLSKPVYQFSVTRLAIGARGDAASLRFVGSLGEIILYPGDTHAATAALDLNLMGQYGVA